MKIRGWIGAGILFTLVGIGMTVIASTQVDFNQELKKTFMDPSLTEKEYELSLVNKVYFNGSAENLKICYTEDENLLTYYEGNNINYDIDYNEEEQTLKIVQNYKLHFSFCLADTTTIYLNQNIEELYLEVSAGNVSIENLSIDKLDVKVNAGNLEIKECNAVDATTSTSAGNMDIKNSYFDTIISEVNAGNLFFYGDIYKNGTFKVDMGNMTLHLVRPSAIYSINSDIDDLVKIKYDVALGNKSILFE